MEELSKKSIDAEYTPYPPETHYLTCLYDIAVTHSPRYKIDMDLPEGGTIFDKMGVDYDDLRQKDNPLDEVVKYFRSTIKTGESLWWINGEEASTGESPAKIRMWKTLSKEEKDDIRAKGFALWDPFSAGGKETLVIKGRIYDKVPHKFAQLYASIEKVSKVIQNTGDEIICETWHLSGQSFQNRFRAWVNLVSQQAEAEPFDVKGLLLDMFEEGARGGVSI